MNTARFNYMRGKEGDGPSDNELREILSQKGRDYYQQGVDAGLSPNDARLKAAQMLSEEFGI